MADKQSQIEKRAEDILTPIAEACGLYVYDVEYVREGDELYLNAYIARREGVVDIGDCERVSRQYSDRLDEEDFITDAYTLVVSSPGLGRRLTKDRHLTDAIGQEVELKCFKTPDREEDLQELPSDTKEEKGKKKAGRKKVKKGEDKEFFGVLKAFDKQTVTLFVEGRDRSFDRKNIARIRLALDF